MKPTPNQGDKFAMFTFIKEGARKISGTNRPVSLRTATVKCDCGKVYDILLSNLGKIGGCGCSKRIYDKLNPEEVIKLYKEYNNADKVAEILNLNNGNAVRKVLKANGLELIRRKYFIDENYFETIDNEEKAYWLGFLAADGTIRLRHGGAEKRKRGSSIVLKLADKDKHHVDRFQKIFGIESRMTHQRDYTTTRSGKESYSDNCRVSINSNKLVEDIIDKGVTPRKSFTLGRPNIKDEYHNHFIRGYFDGNGSISFSLKESTESDREVIKLLAVSIACISHNFIQYLKDELTKENVNLKTNGKYSVAVSNMYECQLFLNYIYKNATLFLERKKEIADKFLKFYMSKKEMAMDNTFKGGRSYK
jgi:intein-encoded DNA endonuclease-like protein